MSRRISYEKMLITNAVRMYNYNCKRGIITNTMISLPETGIKAGREL
jgi:hypothetical protein